MKDLKFIELSGSWYYIGWNEHNALYTHHVQGLKKLEAYISYQGIKHIVKSPYVITLKGKAMNDGNWYLLNKLVSNITVEP